MIKIARRTEFYRIVKERKYFPSVMLLTNDRNYIFVYTTFEYETYKYLNKEIKNNNKKKRIGRDAWRCVSYEFEIRLYPRRHSAVRLG